MDKLHKTIFGCVLGTYLEFLDFALYASLAPVFAIKFFPKECHDVSIIYSWGIFAISFIARPLSGFIFGPLGDKLGIKKILMLSLAIMGFSTVTIGLLPTYDKIGIYAPLLLMALRLLQGFAVGIEYTSLSFYLLQQKNIEKKFGFYSSFTSVGAIAGLISGGLIVGLFLNNSAEINIPDWRWRTPFISCGILVSIAGIYLRTQMQDSQPNNKLGKRIIVDLFSNQLRQILRTIFITGFVSISSYVAIGYMSNYLQLYRNYHIKESIVLCSICNLVMLLSVPIGGFVSDKIGRINFMVVLSASMMIVSIISMTLIAYSATAMLIIGLLLLSINVGIAAGGLPAFVTEIFHAKHRYTGSTIAYNSGVAWIGGTAPMVISFILLKTSNPLIPGLYLSFFSILALFAALSLRAQNSVNCLNQSIT